MLELYQEEYGNADRLEEKNNPEYEVFDSKFSHDYLSIQRNSVTGYERETLVPKVIRELNRTITLDKENRITK